MKLRIEAVDSPNKAAHEFEDDVIVLGRDDVCDLSLPGVSSVSGRHAQIVLTTEGAFLSDVGSTNGTFINDRRVEGRIKVRPGDYFRLGHTGPSFKITEIDLMRSEPVPRFNPAPEPAVQVAILTEPDGHTAPLPSLARPRSEPRSRADSSAPPRPAPPTGSQGQTRMMVMSLQNKNRNLMLVAGGIVLVLFFSGVVASVFFHRKTSQQAALQKDQEERQRAQEELQRNQASAIAAAAATADAANKKDPDAAKNKLYDQVLPSCVWIRGLDSAGNLMWTGSGSLVDAENRLILTNQHVSNEECSGGFVVCFPQRDSEGKVIAERKVYEQRIRDWGIAARLVATDAKRDLAVIQLTKLPEKAVSIGLAKESVKELQPIYCIGGSPSGNEQGMWIVSPGSVRKVYHNVWSYGDQYGRREAVIIASNLGTNSGDSGGAIFDSRGVLVGVNAMGRDGRLVVDEKKKAIRLDMSGSNQNVKHIDISEVRAFLPACYRAIGKAWRE